MPRIASRLFALWATLAGPAFAAPALDVQEAWIAEAPPVARVHAAYMILDNPGDAAVQVVGVSSPNYARVEMHRTVVDEGMARMVRTEAIAVGAGERVVLEPGGMHIMLFEPKERTRVGDQVPLTLELDDGSELDASAEVRQRPSPAQHQPHGHMNH